MITSSRRRALGVAVTRHYEASRLQEQSIACAYEALMPVISSRSRCPHQQAGDLPGATSRTESPQSLPVGA